jgi:rod shape-determining protein MreD
MARGAAPPPPSNSAALLWAGLLPAATTVFAMLLSIQPVHLAGYAALTPAFTLMAVYHWTIYRPDLLPPLLLFTIGAIQDLLSGGTPGVTALLLLLVRPILLSARHHFVGRSFPLIWAGFTALTGGAMLFLWALQSLLSAQLVEFRSVVFRAVLTVSIFPVASFLLGRSQRAFMGVG